MAYEVNDLPGGGRELLFPRLVPGEQVTVTYLYFPPVIWSNINSYTKSDEGLATIINVLPAPRWSPWLTGLAWALIVVGSITVVLAAGQLLVFFVRHFRGA